MRVLRAKQVSTNKWLQRVDTEKDPAVFKRECGQAFAIAGADLSVTETEWTEDQRQSAVTELKAGSHEGLAVVAAPKPSTLPEALAAALDVALADPLVTGSLARVCLALRRFCDSGRVK